MQAVSLANPETLIKFSKDWVPLFISYASAKSMTAEDAETDDSMADNSEPLARSGKTAGSVSLVSTIGGR